jgi:hypothetical protein
MIPETEISHPNCDIIKIFKEFKHHHSEIGLEKRKRKWKNIFYLDDLGLYINQDSTSSEQAFKNAESMIHIWEKLGIINKIREYKFGHISRQDWSHSPMVVYSFRSKWRKHLKKRGQL